MLHAYQKWICLKQRRNSHEIDLKKNQALITPLCIYHHSQQTMSQPNPLSSSQHSPVSSNTLPNKTNQRKMNTSSSPQLGIDGVTLEDVNKYDIWDHRESSVSNAAAWKAACEAYKSTPDFKAEIPHLIHQIWIGTRQPPCVWLDTWRLDFMNSFSKPTKKQQKEWTYRLWDNDSVVDMPMLNRDIFDAESAPQCQADILRLEVLYEYGGVYIDADIVSTVRDLRPALQAANETGFMITYEPDTKDKPYSILGNSLIAVTPKHPLVLMLMSYIRQVYPEKRPFYGVEWVTGPLTYTKVLVHTEMPMTVPRSEDFYPAFHYVPNPSAIDVTKLDSYCFQFGYTCSGLSQWVENNNKCRKAHQCSYHQGVEYALGKLKQFPNDEQIVDVDVDGVIPKVIHQLCFRSEHEMPERWMNTWSVDFCETFGFTYEKWTWQKLKEEIGEFYCANLYDEIRMDAHSMKLLALEIINAKGGYYIPLSSTFNVNNKSTTSEPFSNSKNNSSFYENGSVIGSPVNGSVSMIRKVYEDGSTITRDTGKEIGNDDMVMEMGFADSVTAFTSFKSGSRFLGAGEIHAVLPADSIVARAILAWGYDCQVPTYIYENEKCATKALECEKPTRRVIITDEEFGNMPSLADELPGVLYRLDESNTTQWEYIILNAEYESDHNGMETYTATLPFKSPNGKYVGFVAASTCSDITSLNTEEILSKYESGKILVASLKSTFSFKVSGIFAAMPRFENACTQLTGGDFVPSFERESEEVLDGLLKGFKDSQVAFELQMDDQRRFMFRSWTDGAIDCESRFEIGFDGLNIETLRVFRDGSVVHDVSGVNVS